SGHSACHSRRCCNSGGTERKDTRSENDSLIITLAGGDEFAGDRLLVVTGRTVDTSGLGLESVGLGGTRFIEVDERMRAADGLWAMGDVTGKAMFTHMAVHQSGIIAGDILGEDHAPARYDALPRAVFTDPEVGAVGITEAGARAAGLDVEIAVKRMPYTFRGWLHQASHGVIKLIADRKTGLLLGATACGPSAGEILGLVTLAIHARIPLDDLRSMIYAYPTFYGGIGEAIGAYAKGITTVIDPDYEGFKPVNPE
ncbi:MAG: FAD-dependent oxidoreductase, partial [Chloroflexi bacterium]|nr:FAD-dependent oxidoreductase [Chloroflexota bacterium]